LATPRANSDPRFSFTRFEKKNTFSVSRKEAKGLRKEAQKGMIS
jgi:hypothetical protein